MTTAWPFDPDTRDYVAALLWDALPAYYRIEDQPPRGEGQLREFLRVLAAPLALVRHGVDEHAANLFIDTCSDDALALLAELVGTSLVFPDSDSNRRDVRGTVTWRRRKGTAPMLMDMGRELADRLVVMQEGWRLLALTQDLALLRAERVVPDLRSPIVADISHGPTDRMHHAAGGLVWPRRITHWVHETTTWSVHEGAAAYVGDHVDPRASVTASVYDEGDNDDWRYAVHPLGELAQLRARAVDERDDLRTDRIAAQSFAAAPEQCFGRAGRFTIHINSLPGAIAEPKLPSRAPSATPASPELGERLGSSSGYVLMLDGPRDRVWSPVELRIHQVPLEDGLPQTDAATLQGWVTLVDGSEPGPWTAGAGDGSVDLTNSVLMLELASASGPEGVAFFPGAVVELSGSKARARLAAEHAGLATEGYLRGALIVRLPECWLEGSRWFYIAADGGLVNAQRSGSGEIDVAVQTISGERSLDLAQLATQSHASAWPPSPVSRAGRRLDRIPPARGRGPTILHGGHVLEPAQLELAPELTESALVFAAEFMDAGVPTYRPLVRLRWTGYRATPIATFNLPGYRHGDANATTSWEVLDDVAQIVNLAALDQRHAELSDWRELGPTRLRLVVRFESDLADARLCPAEVAYTSYDGRTTLLHLPELIAGSTDTSATWASAPEHGNVSELVELGEDGSCWGSNGGLLRISNGSVAPLPVSRCHRRRLVQSRNLAPWSSVGGETFLGTKPGKLDVDVERGLFALAIDEFPVPWAPGPGGVQPPNVTVDYEEPGTAAIGARPTDRALMPAPTRIVCGSGARQGDRAQQLHDVPHYATLTEALAAITEPGHEIVQFEDSSSYRDESPIWPQDCTSLTIQAAEGHRPILELADFTGAEAATYEQLSLRGLAWRGVAELALPRATELTILGCTMLAVDETLQLTVEEGEHALLQVSLLAAVVVAGDGALTIDRCAVDCGYTLDNTAIEATTLTVERSTIIGTVQCTALEASESLFIGTVTVSDRYRGCIRYCAVVGTGVSVLPRHHRIVLDPIVHFVSTNRLDPAHLRLEPSTDASVRFGAEDGSELGVFHDLHISRRLEALAQRLGEATPAGLDTSLVIID